MSWFTDRWGQGGPFGATTKAVDRNRGVIGDVVKYGSDIVAPFTGPFAPLVAGAGNAIGTAIKPGTNFGDIAGAGAIGAGVGYAGQALGSAFGAGSGAGAGTTGTAATTGAEAAIPGATGTAAETAASTIAKNAPSSLADKTWNAVKGVGEWAGKHPETIGQGLKAMSEGPVNEAQAKRMALLNQQTEYEMQRQKARDQALNPIYQALVGQAQQYTNGPRTPIARNPYAPR
jgi:hypothetical protein